VSESLARPLPTSGYAIASLVLGILSLVGCSCYGVLSFPLGLMAIAYSGKAREQIRRHEAGANSQGLAKAGGICGWIGVVLGAISLVVMITMILARNL
jgi:hypothetical protein